MNQQQHNHLLHAWIKKVLSEGSNSDKFFFSFSFFLVDEGREIKIPLKADHHRPPAHCVSLAADDDPTLNVGLIFRGIWTSMAKKPFILCVFSEAGGEGSKSLGPHPARSSHALRADSSSRGDALLNFTGQIFASGSAVVYTHHLNTDTFRHMHTIRTPPK